MSPKKAQNEATCAPGSDEPPSAAARQRPLQAVAGVLDPVLLCIAAALAMQQTMHLTANSRTPQVLFQGSFEQHLRPRTPCLRLRRRCQGLPIPPWASTKIGRKLPEMRSTSIEFADDEMGACTGNDLLIYPEPVRAEVRIWVLVVPAVQNGCEGRGLRAARGPGSPGLASFERWDGTALNVQSRRA